MNIVLSWAGAGLAIGHAATARANMPIRRAVQLMIAASFVWFERSSVTTASACGAGSA